MDRQELVTGRTTHVVERGFAATRNLLGGRRTLLLPSKKTPAVSVPMAFNVATALGLDPIPILQQSVKIWHQTDSTISGNRFVDDMTGQENMNHAQTSAASGPAQREDTPSTLSPRFTDDDSFSQYSLASSSIYQYESPATTPPASPLIPPKSLFTDDEGEDHDTCVAQPALHAAEGSTTATTAPQQRNKFVDHSYVRRIPTELPHLTKGGQQHLNKRLTKSSPKPTRVPGPVKSAPQPPPKIRTPRAPSPETSIKPGPFTTKRKRALQNGDVPNKRPKQRIHAGAPSPLVLIQWNNDLIRLEEIVYHGKQGAEQANQLATTLSKINTYEKVPKTWVLKTHRLRTDVNGREVVKTTHELIKLLAEEYEKVPGTPAQLEVEARELLEAWAPFVE